MRERGEGCHTFLNLLCWHSQFKCHGYGKEDVRRIVHTEEACLQMQMGCLDINYHPPL